MQIVQMVQEIWSGHKLRVNHMTLKCDLDLESALLSQSSAHCLTKRNIRVKFNENRSKGSGDMERTRNLRVNPMT